MQYDRAADGTLTPLPFQSVDTGMGLERTASVMQGVESNYRTDLFVPIIDRLAEHLGHRPEEVEAERFSYQVVADHSRAMTFLIAEGVHPTNDGAGYVLRRIMRRAVRHVRLMRISAPVLGETCAAVIDLMGDAYPTLAERREAILDEVRAEEARFARTLEAGSERLSQLVEAAGPDGRIAGDEAFRLHDTFGFPIDLTIEIAAESGATVDRDGFDTAMSAQRERSRGAQHAGYRSDPELAGLSSTFVGFPNETVAEDLEVLAVRPGGDGSTAVVLAETPFYAEGGGQVGDHGRLVGLRGTLEVTDTQRDGDAIVHLGSLEGTLEMGERVRAEVDRERRLAAARNHTATHLLHRALRNVLGEQAKQAGSWVGPDGLRFDFPSDAPTSRDALTRVEGIVNEQVRNNLDVTPTWMPLAEAQGSGADMFFGEKYLPDSVRVVACGDFSRELCGGTHLAATGQIGSFRITGESSIGTGLRRIEAVTGAAAEAMIATRLEALRATAHLLGARDDEVPARVEALQARVRDAERGDRAGTSARPRLDAAAALRDGQDAGDAKVIVQRYADADANALRTLVDDLRESTGRFVAVVAGEADGQPTLVVATSRDLAAEGFDAADVIRRVAPLIKGGGGGRADMAQAGGSDPTGLDGALAEATRLTLESLAALEGA
jgi:alanyl-tRNA synthetase